jgi:TDG/mug DNA glycosylase family protein
VDRETVRIYEAAAEAYDRARPAPDVRFAAEFATTVRPGAVRADLGCGPGRLTRALGTPVVALDAAMAMLELCARRAPHAHRVRADLEALPFARGSLGGAFAAMSYVHLRTDRLPLALAELHRALEVGGPLWLTMLSDVGAGRRGGGWGRSGVAGPGGILPNDDFPGRLFAAWAPELLCDVVVGAGFEVLEVRTTGPRQMDLVLKARRSRSLPDLVGPRMRVLVCGLNPSTYAADRGVPFARPGNRFWQAALAAGLVHSRDPDRVLSADGVGFTDLVKRATARAGGVAASEYREGRARLERLVRLLRPRVVCFVGLSGYRAAVDPAAGPGPCRARFAGALAYLMPSTSAANAHATLEDLTAHLREVRALACSFPAQTRPKAPPPPS